MVINFINNFIKLKFKNIKNGDENMKNDKTKLIIWAVVALVIGVVIGTFLVAPATTGNAKAALTPTNYLTPMDKIPIDEMAVSSKCKEAGGNYSYHVLGVEFCWDTVPRQDRRIY